MASQQAATEPGASQAPQEDYGAPMEYADMGPPKKVREPHSDDEEINYAPMDDANVPPSPADSLKRKPSTFSTASTERLMSVASSNKPPRPSVMIGVSPTVLGEMSPLRSGWLHKRGNINKQWKLRWCVLKGGNVYYFKTPQDEVQRGQFSLSRMAIKKTPTESRPWAFRLVPYSGKGRQWVLAAPTERDMSAWIKDMRAEVMAYNDAPERGDDTGDNDQGDDTSAGSRRETQSRWSYDETSAQYLEPTVRRFSSSSSDDDDGDSDGYDRPYDDAICDAEADTFKRHIATEAKLPPKPMQPRLETLASTDQGAEGEEASPSQQQREGTTAAADDTSGSATTERADQDNGDDGHDTEKRPPPPLPVRRSLLVASGGLVPLDTNLRTCSWYFEGASRAQAEAMLTTPGTFLVRRKSQTAEPALSLKTYDRCLHYKIYFVQDKGFTFGAEDKAFFPSVVHLLRHYQQHELPAIGIMLGAPIDV